MITAAVRYRAGLPRAENCIACPSTFHLVVDHCHQHGWVRGTLCGRCNSWMLWLEMGRVPVAAARSQTEVVENLTAHRLRCPDCAAEITAARKPTMSETPDHIVLTGPTPLQRVANALRATDADLGAATLYLNDPNLEALHRAVGSLREAVGALADQALLASLRAPLPEDRRDD